MKLIFLSFLFLLGTLSAKADSVFGPHPSPAKGPWFEGWYMRITDLKEHRSMAVITTTQLNPQEKFELGKGSSGYLAILVQNGEGQATQSFETFPQKTFIKTHGRDNHDFTWEAPQYGWLSPKGFQLQIPNKIEAQAKLSESKPWNRYWSNWGPEGWAAFIPIIPLHWFVQSLSTQADYFLKFKDSSNQWLEFKSQGTAHLEKNWGKTFPKSWVWLQADDAKNKKSVALAGGVLKMGPANVKTYLAGYKSEKINADFQMGQMLDLKFTDKINPCNGEYEAELENGEYKMKIKAHAPAKSFSRVSIPTLKGYRKNGAKESFSTAVIVEIYNNNWVRDLSLKNPLIERTLFKKAALEFGGEAMNCENNL